jgi:hypothetical protein
MAVALHHYWKGKAPAVAQVSTVQVTGYDASTSYRLTVGGIVIAVNGTTDANGTAAALAAAWNASTHPYCTGVTASSNTSTVTLTADTAGVPFVVTSSVSGGTGTIGSVTLGTASAGPNDFTTAANWENGVPVVETGTAQAGASGTITLASGASSTDDYYKGYVVKTTGGTGSGQYRPITAYNGTTKVATVETSWSVTPDNTTPYSIGPKVSILNSNTPILWGLDQSSLFVSELNIAKTFVAPGQIGLYLDRLQTGASSSVTTATEYREDWLKIAAYYLNIGQHFGSGSPTFAPMVKVNTSGAPTIAKVWASGSSDNTDTRQPVRLLISNAAATLAIYGNSTKVGVGVEEPTDSGQLASVAAYADSGQVTIGSGITLATLEVQRGEAIVLNAPSTIVVEAAGTVRATGTGTISVVEARGSFNPVGGKYAITEMRG